jgi:hypothetical protein
MLTSHHWQIVLAERELSGSFLSEKVGCDGISDLAQNPRIRLNVRPRIFRRKLGWAGTIA